MIQLQQLTREQAERTIAEQELPADLRRIGRFTALAATQDWCPDWHAVSRWLESHASNGRPEDIDITVFTVEYNRLECFESFLEMKEQTWQNYFVPYIRYYVDGELVDESNSVSADAFVTTFRHSAAALDSGV